MTDLVSVDVGSDADGGLEEDGEGQQAAVGEDHLVTLPGDAAAAEESDEDDQGARHQDDQARDLEDAGGEEREELSPVHQAPESQAEPRQAEHEEEDVVAVERELEAGERTQEGASLGHLSLLSRLVVVTVGVSVGESHLSLL